MTRHNCSHSENFATSPNRSFESCVSDDDVGRAFVSRSFRNLEKEYVIRIQLLEQQLCEERMRHSLEIQKITTAHKTEMAALRMEIERLKRSPMGRTSGSIIEGTVYDRNISELAGGAGEHLNAHYTNPVSEYRMFTDLPGTTMHEEESSSAGRAAVVTGASDSTTSAVDNRVSVSSTTPNTNTATLSSTAASAAAAASVSGTPTKSTDIFSTDVHSSDWSMAEPDSDKKRSLDISRLGDRTDEDFLAYIHNFQEEIRHLQSRSPDRSAIRTT
jgi:hypothetical protein